MSGILSQSSYSVRRLIDGKSVNFILQTNQPTTQLFTPDPATFLPNYTTGAFLVVTPSLMVSGTAGDQISKLKTAPSWKINGSTDLASFGATASSSVPYTLTIKKNLVDVSAIKIDCSSIYVQPNTLAELAVQAAMTFSKVSNNGAAITTNMYVPKGNIFKNDLITSLIVHCDLVRGATIDNTNVTYTWAINQTGTWVILTSANAATYGITGFTTNEIVVPANTIINVGLVKCTIKDTDTGSSTYNQTVESIQSLIDMSDAYDIDVVCGNVPEGGTTQAKVIVKQGATVLPDSFFTGKVVKHYRKTSATGGVDTTWADKGYKVGREITITEADLLVGMETYFGTQLEG